LPPTSAGFSSNLQMKANFFITFLLIFTILRSVVSQKYELIKIFKIYIRLNTEKCDGQK
jgi:hypothetical protein